MAASIKIRVARIHWLICASVCALVAVWYLYVAVIESFFQGRIAHTSHFPRSPLLANFDSVPNTDDSKQERDCDLYSCFDVSKCIHSSDNHVTVHLYGGDVSQTVFAGDDDVPPSREHSDMIDAVLTSSYSIEGPYKACLFIPPLDLLNQQKLTPSLAQEYLQLLPQYVYHLLFCSVLYSHRSSNAMSDSFVPCPPKSNYVKWVYSLAYCK